MTQKIEQRRSVDGRSFRFTNFVDSESLEFESQAEGFLADASLEQRLDTIRKSERAFYVMQMRGETGNPMMQVCVRIGRPKRLPAFAMATVPGLWHAKVPAEEEIAMKVLREFVAHHTGAMTLRLQAQRFDSLSLLDFQDRGIRQGFGLTNPDGVVRTRVVDLQESEEEFQKTLPRNLKRALQHRGRDSVELRVLKDSRYIEACQAALDASHRRTGGVAPQEDFRLAFRLAETAPDRARIIGLFFKDRPDKLMAYVIGFRRGDGLEYGSGGSLSDERLRLIPFNYFLCGELITWARQQGCRRFDLRGVSDGGPHDPMRGITQFKRAFPGVEVETGREMVAVLRPYRFFLYRVLKKLRRFFHV